MKLEGDIVAGARAGQIELRSPRTVCIELLGPFDQESIYTDAVFLAWAAVGVQIRFDRKKDRAEQVYCYFTTAEFRETLATGGDSVPEHLGVCVLNTDLGVTTKSTEADVRRIYGKPKQDFRDDDDSWCRLEYPGIDFRFVNATLTRISIRRARGVKTVRPSEV